MFVGIVKIKLHAEWVRSLKEKRMIVQSIIGKTRSRFNISIHEVDALDKHQTIVLGVSMISNSEKELGKTVNKVIDFIESHTEATVTDIDTEIV